WRTAWDWTRWPRASKPRRSGNTLRLAVRIRFRGSCSAGLWASRNWNSGTPTGCMPAASSPRARARGSGPRPPPDHFAAVFMTRQDPSQHEQEIGQPIQVLERLGRDTLGARQRPTAALGAPADGP